MYQLIQYITILITKERKYKNRFIDRNVDNGDRIVDSGDITGDFLLGMAILA